MPQAILGTYFYYDIIVYLKFRFGWVACSLLASLF